MCAINCKNLHSNSQFSPDMLHFEWQQLEQWQYITIPWDYIDNQWWSLPVEFILVFYCFIGFHAASDSHLLPSLDTFCRKLNISHHTAQPTIYALGAVAPIIILSNAAFAADIIGITTNAHRLGIGSIIGFGLTTSSLIPSFSVFSLVSMIILPKKTTIRDQLFIIILLSIFLAIILSGMYSLIPTTHTTQSSQKLPKYLNHRPSRMVEIECNCRSLFHLLIFNHFVSEDQASFQFTKPVGN